MTISKRTREALFVHAEGRSALSGAPLEATWEVDHKIPRVAGGTDELTNLQPLTADENRVKSMATPPELRDWQKEFITAWDRDLASSFLLVALPGVGKTIAALWAARDWIEHDSSRRKVVIVVPTDALRDQWKHEASALFGLQFQTRGFESWNSQMVGFVLSYQGLAGHSELWQMRCRQNQILAIFDEIHHAGENNWGGQLKECFTGATRRLPMSGTPFRGDSTRMPFVNYDGEGMCVANYRYDYPRAINDGVIRVVKFQHERGIVRRLTARGEDELELSSTTSEDSADDALRHILRPGRYTEAVLRLAHAQLLQCRESMPNAGALAICIDQAHAEQIAKQLERLTGQKPDLVVSDDERATSTVEDFRASSRPWVVAVRQISEGVDIKRLMCLAYLTTCRSPLFFRQAVGRIVRTMGTPEDMEAYCFIPDHPTLVRHARQITEAQVQAIEDGSDAEFKREIDRLQPSLLPPDIVSTEHTGTAGTIIEGEDISPQFAADIKGLATKLGCGEAIARRVLKLYGPAPHQSGAGVPPPSQEERRSPQRPLEDQLTDASRLLDRAVKRAVFRVLPEDDPKRFPKVNAFVNRFVGKWDRRLFGLDDYRRALARLETLKPGDVA